MKRRHAHQLPSRRAEAALMAVCIGILLALIVTALPPILYQP